MTLTQLLVLALMAGLLELDNVAVLQAMFSRPLVTGVVAGLVLGDAASGAAVGGLLELIFVGSLPIGAVVPPSLSLAGIFGAAAVITLAPGPVSAPEAISSISLLAACAVGWVGGWVEVRARHLQGRIAQLAEEEAMRGDDSALGRGLLRGLGVTALRGSVVALVSLALVLPALSLVLKFLPLWVWNGLSWFYWLAVLLGLVALLDLFWERKYLRAFAISLFVCSILIYGFKVSPVALLPMAALAAAALWRWKSVSADLPPQGDSA